MWLPNLFVVAVVLAIAWSPFLSVDDDAAAICEQEIDALGDDAGWSSESACARAYTKMREDDYGDFLCFEMCVEDYEEDKDVRDLKECRSDCQRDLEDEDDDGAPSTDGGDADEQRRLDIINECNLGTCSTGRGTDAWHRCLEACCISKGLSSCRG